jgi:very-short-patch-repair endonuclease
LKPRRIPTDPEILAYARKMRHSARRAERRAWVLLRERRMLGLKFHCQFPIANYIVDFYCEHLRLVLELDGGVHDDPKQARNDERRNTYLRDLGYHVLRVPNGLVLQAPDQLECEIKKFLIGDCVEGLRCTEDPSSGASRHLLPEGEG